MFNRTKFDKNYFNRSTELSPNYIINGYSNLKVNPTFLIPLNVTTEGSGNFEIYFATTFFLQVNVSGESAFIPPILVNIRSVFLHLENIEVLPGETFIIDTDLLTVMFGDQYDISAITTDSVFFQLAVGSNQLIYEAEFDPPITQPGDGCLYTKLIWRNRWL